MKKVFLGLAILFTGISLYAGTWLHDYDHALKQAKKVHKPIIMMYSAKD